MALAFADMLAPTVHGPPYARLLVCCSHGLTAVHWAWCMQCFSPLCCAFAAQVPAASPQQLEEWREKWLAVQERVVAQEQLASAVSAQWMDAQGAHTQILGMHGAPFALRGGSCGVPRLILPSYMPHTLPPAGPSAMHANAHRCCTHCPCRCARLPVWPGRPLPAAPQHHLSRPRVRCPARGGGPGPLCLPRRHAGQPAAGCSASDSGRCLPSDQYGAARHLR